MLSPVISGWRGASVVPSEQFCRWSICLIVLAIHCRMLPRCGVRKTTCEVVPSFQGSECLTDLVPSGCHVASKKLVSMRTTISDHFRDVRCWMLFLGCLMVGILLPMHGHACVMNKGRVSVILGFLLKKEQGFRLERTGRFFAIKEATDLSNKFDSLETNQSSSD